MYDGSKYAGFDYARGEAGETLAMGRVVQAGTMAGAVAGLRGRTPPYDTLGVKSVITRRMNAVGVDVTDGNVKCEIDEVTEAFVTLAVKMADQFLAYKVLPGEQAEEGKVPLEAFGFFHTQRSRFDFARRSGATA